jgi:hypothetical protein
MIRLCFPLLAILAAASVSAADGPGETFVLEGGKRIPVLRAEPVNPPSLEVEGLTVGVFLPGPSVDVDAVNERRTSRQTLGVRSRVSVENGPELGYDFDARIQRVDPFSGDHLDPAMSQTVGLGHRASVGLKGPGSWRFNGSSGWETSLRNDRPDPEHAVLHKSGVSWRPLPRSTVGVEAGTVERFDAAASRSHEDSFSARLEQRLADWPVHVSLSRVQSRQTPTAARGPLIERNRWMPSVRWAIDGDKTVSLGLESATVSREAEGAVQRSDIHAAELRFDAAERLALRVRGGLESRTLPPENAGDPAPVEVLPSLSTGVDYRVSPSFTTGIGVQFAPGSAPSPDGTDRTAPFFTLFGSAAF